MQNKEDKNDTQSLGEELTNAITHGIGAALSIAGLVVLVVFASIAGDVWRIVSLSIYGSTLVLLFLSSTLYHSFSSEKLKSFFQIIDHIAIYLLIAGTYTPITLVYLRGPWGWTLFGLIWGMAVCGIVFKTIFMGKLAILSVIFYAAMGWLIVIALKPMLSSVPTGLLWWIVIGGASYTIGIIFFALDKMPYNHAVWHLFVLGGAISHFFGMLFYLSLKP